MRFAMVAQTGSQDRVSLHSPPRTSVTIEKTVTISPGGPTDAVIDAHFLIDTSSSMGSQVDAAKAAATNLFNSLNSSFGDVQASVGVFSEDASLDASDPRARVVIGGGLTDSAATFQGDVNQVTLNIPDFGFDFPESGWDGIALAGDDLSWRTGSTRFMFVFTDATAKGELATAQEVVSDNDINIVVLSYGDLDEITADYATPFGGEAFAATTSAEGVIEDVTAGITSGFSNYDAVSVSDLGAGLLDGIDVSVVCTGAASGVCNGDTAEGDYDRSIENLFTFDVTFTNTGLAAGDSTTFDTFALVDGGIVATEVDTFNNGEPIGPAPVPLPAAGWMLLAGLGGLAAMRRRSKAK